MTAKLPNFMPAHHHCLDCQAPIFHERTKDGTRLRVEVEPHIDGTIEMRKGLAVFVGVNTLPLFPGEPRYRNHDDVCPNRAHPSSDGAAKRAYVRTQGQARRHSCHWPGCDKQVPPALWGCKEHWFRLPRALRDRIWATYREGQEQSGRPSTEYVDAARDVQDWIQKVGRHRA